MIEVRAFEEHCKANPAAIEGKCDAYLCSMFCKGTHDVIRNKLAEAQLVRYSVNDKPQYVSASSCASIADMGKGLEFEILETWPARILHRPCTEVHPHKSEL